MKPLSVRRLTFAALIAAVYAALTIALSFISYGPVQFRIAEALCILPFFMPFTAWGLFVGCILSNIISPVGPLDMIFGSLATLFAALLMAALRRIRVFNIPVLSLLMPALMNGLIVGFEIEFFFINNAKGFMLGDFLVQGGLVALGELAVLFVLGLPLAVLTEKRELDKKLRLVPFGRQ